MTRSRIVVVGVGGHGQVVADILLAARRAGQAAEPIGFLDDDERLVGACVLGLPVLGRVEQLAQFDFDTAIVGIGDNVARRRVTRFLAEGKVPLANAIHPSAVISPSAVLGKGITIAAGVVVNTGSVVEDGVILNTSCSVDHHCWVRAFAHVAPGARLAGNVDVGEGALLGIGGIAIPGRLIGSWSVVGAGAVVTKDVPSLAVAVGVPARIIRYIEQVDNLIGDREDLSI